MESGENEKPLSRVEHLEKRKAEISKQIKRGRARSNKEKRKWENNQKIRVEAAIISEFKGKPEKMAELLTLLDSFYTKDYDRKYFVEWGLPPLHKSTNPPELRNEGQ